VTRQRPDDAAESRSLNNSVHTTWWTVARQDIDDGRFRSVRRAYVLGHHQALDERARRCWTLSPDTATPKPTPPEPRPTLLAAKRRPVFDKKHRTSPARWRPDTFALESTALTDIGSSPRTSSYDEANGSIDRRSTYFSAFGASHPGETSRSLLYTAQNTGRDTGLFLYDAVVTDRHGPGYFGHPIDLRGDAFVVGCGQGATQSMCPTGWRAVINVFGSPDGIHVQ